MDALEPFMEQISDGGGGDAVPLPGLSVWFSCPRLCSFSSSSSSLSSWEEGVSEPEENTLLLSRTREEESAAPCRRLVRCEEVSDERRVPWCGLGALRLLFLLMSMLLLLLLLLLCREGLGFASLSSLGIAGYNAEVFDGAVWREEDDDDDDAVADLFLFDVEEDEDEAVGFVAASPSRFLLLPLLLLLSTVCRLGLCLEARCWIVARI
jgi:hypothetical protein